jgi:hypothetical protein
MAKQKKNVVNALKGFSVPELGFSIKKNQPYVIGTLEKAVEDRLVKLGNLPKLGK